MTPHACLASLLAIEHLSDDLSKAGLSEHKYIAQLKRRF
jgi:hypothetical protein